uniref:HTH myb-type domain-containing protein n=1 Tax=Aureoumbra lagunensis TaxID=44058 RepID=A0A7S3NHD4_9STRA|mmetsp:Transcript_16750/g.25169  ORF Transcript_16750/g.25169 Transcript_16750/m.25169 type:complete len:437 (+) Transcript_16750:66-1376(+)|eukprot:CAMPEP_0197306564 /NCGR_PEP_ID=MMETSP0891-20130614/3524_1 /TAXON_ID=44058 ORGANISM="Aureoumbra lagunensis, Strain CCMP1510" /NCGR_SAMPLE_ID=MMETSP0891 /ASSEMBLY_ACC=CAM_ASM_000534 /LENGTH=436 /DNA_ID=CAMNT_0042788955 /DNA_START=25 /DNA_END=1335 /DNA_ORIENTATION=+
MADSVVDVGVKKKDDEESSNAPQIPPPPPPPGSPPPDSQMNGRTESMIPQGSEINNVLSGMGGIANLATNENLLSGSSSSLTFRSEASWPLRSQIHTVFADGFPKLKEKLASNEPNEHGNYIYHFGFCDFDSQENADRASQCLKELCDGLSTAVHNDDKESMNKLRQGLEGHLCYWKKNPTVTQPMTNQLPPLGAIGGRNSSNELLPITWDNALDESSRTATLTAAAAAVAGGSARTSSANNKNNDEKGIKSGRWTAQEHQLFLSLMKEHGRSWTQIANNMPTRSEPQVRSHAQKYFLKQDGGKSMKKKNHSSLTQDNDIDDDGSGIPGLGIEKKPKRQKRVQENQNNIVHTTATPMFNPAFFQQIIPNPQLVQNVRVFDQFGLNNTANFLNVASPQNPQAALMTVAGVATDALPATTTQPPPAPAAASLPATSTV